VFLMRGNATDAEAEIRAALELDPQNQLGLAARGESHYRQGRWEQAASYFEASRSTQAEVLLHLCDAYIHMESRDKARSTADLLRTLCRDDRQALAALDALVKHRL
jgi:uncharacterized protein HemY